jgi:hypothetical protein
MDTWIVSSTTTRSSVFIFGARERDAYTFQVRRSLSLHFPYTRSCQLPDRDSVTFSMPFSSSPMKAAESLYNSNPFEKLRTHSVLYTIYTFIIANIKW